jgi:hypothetical protein
MQQEPFIITFREASVAEANRYATDMAASLRDIDQNLSAEQRRDRSETQDFGATVAIVLGTASATAVAKGVATWLARNSGAKIDITVDGNVIASNLDSRDAAKIAEVFAKRR